LRDRAPLRCRRAGTPVGNQGFLHADRELDLQREQASRRSSVDAEIACLSDGRFEDLSLALGIDDRRIAGVLPGGHVLHQPQPILHRSKYGAHVRIRVGKCRSGAGRRRQQEQEEDRERAEHGSAAYTFNAAASPDRAGG
jgi:hypothetical protein